MFNKKVYETLLNNPIAIGKALEKLRKDAHLTQTDLAKKLELYKPNSKFDRNSIYRVETAQALPIEILLAYCIYFKKDLEELIAPQSLTESEELKKVFNLLPSNLKELFLETGKAWL